MVRFYSGLKYKKKSLMKVVIKMHRLFQYWINIEMIYEMVALAIPLLVAQNNFSYDTPADK